MGDENQDELLKLARTVSLPSWATHVAVRTNGSKAEPAAWLETSNDFVDEDPSERKDGEWIGSYKHYYWRFFSRERLNSAIGE